jgi:membrane protein DedA with SNARE-associated domain
MEALIPYILTFVQKTFELMQWPGVVLLMALESACVPIPSEVIMPLSGWMLISELGLDASLTFMAAFYGALGCTIGSAAAYGVGYWGGRPLAAKYGRFLLISNHDLEVAEGWFRKYGNIAFFFSRLLPVVRTFISLPAGVARAPFRWFLPLTFLGSFPWCLALAWAGYHLGEHWAQVYDIIRPFSDGIIVMAVLGIAFFFYKHITRYRKYRTS